MKVELKGILQAKVEDLSSLPEVAPKGFIYLDAEDLHITLLTMKELRSSASEFRNKWKEYEKLIPPFPRVSFKKPYIARATTATTTKGRKCSWVVDLDAWSQIKVWNWLYRVLSLMCLEDQIQPGERVFHVSLANLTGSKYDSVPEPWIEYPYTPFGVLECWECERYADEQTAREEGWLLERPSSCGCGEPGQLCPECKKEYEPSSCGWCYG